MVQPAGRCMQGGVSLLLPLLLPLLLLLLGSCTAKPQEEGCGQEGAKPDPEQCDKYWECRGGVLTPQFCPDGLVYDLTTSVASFQVGSGAPPSDGSRCSYPFAIDCSGRSKLQPPQPKNNCPRDNGYFPVPGRCDQYWFCGSDRAATLHTCPKTLVFAPDQGRCTWVGEAHRPGCEAVDTFHEDFLCPEAGFGVFKRYPDPADCRAYFVCVSGTATRSVCPAGEAFNPASVSCGQEASLPKGLCSSQLIWEDRNSTSSLAPTIKIPKTRTRTSGRKPTVNRATPIKRVTASKNRPVQTSDTTIEESGGELAESDGRAPLDCVSCRVSGIQAQGPEAPVRLQDNSVLVGQQKARDKTLFLDSSGQTTTTAIPRRLRTRTRLTATNGQIFTPGLKDKVVVEGSRGQNTRTRLTATNGQIFTPGLKDKVVVEGSRGQNTRTRLTATNGQIFTPGLKDKVVVEGRRGLNRVRGRVTRPKSTQAESGERSPAVTRQRTVMRLEKDERSALGERSRVRVRGRQRVRGSVARPVQKSQETLEVTEEDMSDIAS